MLILLSEYPSKGVQWSFNPQAAPNFDGVHEIMVRSVKKAIRDILENADMNDQELDCWCQRFD